MSQETLRTQNTCLECDYTWFPRGKELSHKCPRCGSENIDYVRVEAAQEGEGCLSKIGGALGLAFLVAIGFSWIQIAVEELPGALQEQQQSSQTVSKYYG